jgi:type IV pilus assembly protein PilE
VIELKLARNTLATYQKSPTQQKRTKSMRGIQKGFTLIEIMIVVAIIGILAAIAIPQYQDYVLRANIQEATSTLSDYRTRMEQWYQDNRTYAPVAGGATCGVIPLPAATIRWTYTCVSAAAGQTFIVTATGIATNTMNQFRYTIDQANNRVSDVNTRWGGYTNQPRWITSKGG